MCTKISIIVHKTVLVFNKDNNKENGYLKGKLPKKIKQNRMLTLKELAAQWEVPETTLRLLREEFADVIPVVGEGRRRRYTDDGAALLKQIVAWRREGWSAVKIRTELHRTRQPQPGLTRRASEEHWHDVTARLAAQSAEIALLRVEVGVLRSELARLVDILRPTPPPTVQSILEASE